MQNRRVGSSGLSVSALTLGTLGWGTDVDVQTVREIAGAYREAGGRSFDTAYGYGDGAAEEALGGLLGDVLPRDEVTITTKAGISRESGTRVVNAGRGALLDQLDRSLDRLGTDHVDLWLVHTWDENVPVTETLSALHLAVRSGRARYIGVSNYVGWQLARAASISEHLGFPLIANQVEFSLLRRGAQNEIAPAADHLGIGLLAWSPLARGVLSGKYRHTVPADSRGAQRPDLIDSYLDVRGRAVVEAVCTAADGLGAAPAQVALAWLLDRPEIAAAVAGARTVPQVRALCAADELQIPEQVAAALADVSA